MKTVFQDLGRDPSNRDAWGRFFDLMWPFMVVVARKYATGIDGFEPEDLVQDALIKLSQGLHENRIELRDEKSCKSLLAVILHRVAIDQSRKNKSRISADPFSKLEDSTPFGAIVSQINELGWSDLMHFLGETLDPEESSILELRLQGYDNKEIAGKLGVHKRTIARKIEKIRVIVEKHGRS